MKTLHKHLLAAAMLAALGAGAVAQVPTPATVAPGGQRAEMVAHRGHHGGDRMERKQLRQERRLAALKLKLQLSPAQEGAWTAWTTAMKPPANLQRPDRAELRRLPTPERIDRMRALRSQRMAEADRRGDATKAFYNQLSADQKRVFDLESVRGGKRGKRGMRHGMGHGGGHGRG